MILMMMMMIDTNRNIGIENDILVKVRLYKVNAGKPLYLVVVNTSVCSF